MSPSHPPGPADPRTRVRRSACFPQTILPIPPSDIGDTPSLNCVLSSNFTRSGYPPPPHPRAARMVPAESAPLSCAKCAGRMLSFTNPKAGRRHGRVYLCILYIFARVCVCVCVWVRVCVHRMVHKCLLRRQAEASRMFLWRCRASARESPRAVMRCIKFSGHSSARGACRLIIIHIYIISALRHAVPYINT